MDLLKDYGSDSDGGGEAPASTVEAPTTVLARRVETAPAVLGALSLMKRPGSEEKEATTTKTVISAGVTYTLRLKLSLAPAVKATALRRKLDKLCVTCRLSFFPVSHLSRHVLGHYFLRHARLSCSH